MPKRNDGIRTTLDPRSSIVNPNGRVRRPYRTRRQEEILDHLERFFLANGFRHLTLQDLTDELRCSRTILYAIAPTKEELALVVIDRFFRKVGAAVIAATSQSTVPAARLEGILDAIANSFEPATDRFMIDLDAYGPSYDLHMKHHRYAVANVQTIVTEGIENGSFRPIDASFAAEVVNIVMSSIADMRLPENAGLTSAQAVTQLRELLFHGLLLEDRTTAREPA